MPEPVIGLFLLGILGAFGIHGALNSSEFSIRNFVKDKASADSAKRALVTSTVMNLSLAASLPAIYGTKGLVPGMGVLGATAGLGWRYWTIIEAQTPRDSLEAQRCTVCHTTLHSLSGSDYLECDGCGSTFEWVQ